MRRWRTSHTGGHRFAPTALILPQGQYWAYLDEGSLRSILDQSGDPAELAGQYRGSAACGSGAEQAAEREAFVRHGWEWLGWARSTEDLGGGRVHVHFEQSRADAREPTRSTRRSPGRCRSRTAESPSRPGPARKPNYG